MNVTATVKNSHKHNEMLVSTEGNEKEIKIHSGPSGFGSEVSGAELLFLSLATCFCNDLYREAAKRDMKIESVSVHVKGQFDREGEPGYHIRYKAEVEAPAHTQSEIEHLIDHVDAVAEIHNTLREGVTVLLNN